MKGFLLMISVGALPLVLTAAVALGQITTNGSDPQGWIKSNRDIGAKSNDNVLVTSICDFETDYICGFTQDKTDDFNWTRGAGKTPSEDTGPSSDHTYRTPQGHYMYIETSVPRKQHERAKLMSPPMLGPATPKCLVIWYHMFGATMGSLYAYVKRGFRTYNLLKITGNQGDHWNLAKMPLASAPSDSSYQLVFVGEVGNGWHGDLAIDDLSVIDGACPNDTKLMHSRIRYEVNMFKDATFKTPLQGTPPNDSQVYVQVISPSSPEVFMVLDSCEAFDPRDRKSFPLIKHHCVLKSTTNILIVRNHETRFKFDMIDVLADHGFKVTCSVRFCDQKDLSAECDQICQVGSNPAIVG